VAAAVRVALMIGVGAVTLSAQPTPEPSPAPLLSVETRGIEPTVAMTGDILTATYRVRFQDLIDQGREIVILEDRMAPDKLPLAPFEGVGLTIEKHRVERQHVWEFHYRLRIVGPKKDVQTLRSITFFYLLRTLGQKIEDADVLQAETEPLEVRYVSTMTGEPTLDIHDAIELGSFGNRVVLLRGLAWLVAPLPLLFWTVGALRAARRPAGSIREVAGFEPRLDIVATVAAPATVAEARRALRRCLRPPPSSGDPMDGQARPDFQRDVVIALRNYLLAEVPSLNPGDTAREIRQRIETLQTTTSRAGVLKQLAARLVMYQTTLEIGAPATDPILDADDIERLVGSLHWPTRVCRWTVTRRRS
jgi:hypothetical protein